MNYLDNVVYGWHLRQLFNHGFSPHRVARDAKRNTLFAIYFVTTAAKEVLNNVQKNMARSA
jgi:hypothetical protein